MGDMNAAMKAIRYFAGWSDKVTGQTIPVGKGSRQQIIHTVVIVFKIMMHTYKIIAYMEILKIH